MRPDGSESTWKRQERLPLQAVIQIGELELKCAGTPFAAASTSQVNLVHKPDDIA